MTSGNFPKKPFGPFISNCGNHGVEDLLARLFADTETQMQQMMAEIATQVHYEENNEAFIITVNLNGIEQAKDIDARFENGYLHLCRSVQLETEHNSDSGAIRQQYYQHFARTLLIPAPIDWSNRKIDSRPGRWSIWLPKRYAEDRKHAGF